MEKHNVAQFIKEHRSGTYKITADGKTEKRRLFVTKDGQVCEFNKRSKKYGHPVSAGDMESWIAVVKEVVTYDDTKLTAKYKRLAKKASFTNPFIRKCLSADETKCPYDNRLTTGTQIDGKVITLKSVLENAPYYGKMFINALKERKDYHTYSKFEFRGYEASLWVSVVNEDNTDPYYNVGDVCAGITFYQKRGCKEYSYLLINDESFIGYDVD